MLIVAWLLGSTQLGQTLLKIARLPPHLAVLNACLFTVQGTYTVTIKDITCAYSGKVLCRAVNEFGQAESEATLLVLPRGEPPDFIEWLRNISSREGSKVVHKVVFTGDKPTLTW